jgi:hypothetical protein
VTSATFRGTAGVAVDGQGNVYISDYGNNRVRKVSTSGTISNYAGTGTAGFSGDGGPATLADLDAPIGLAVDGQGNLYIADAVNDRVRKVSTNGTITTIAGGGNNGLGDGGPATSAQLRSPHGLAVDGQGDVYIADTGDHRVRKVSPDGIITTFAGTSVTGPPTSGNGGPATSANMSPADVAVDGRGNVYIADYGNNLVREVTPGGTISTVAGIGTAGSSGDGGPATSAELNYPMGVAVDGQGNVDIYMNFEVREVSGGTITTIADETDTNGNSGDGGPATAAEISGATAGATGAVAVDGKGNVYISDWTNNRVRKIAPSVSPPYIPVGSQPAAGADKNGDQFVFWKGSDSHLWEAWYSHKRWQGPVSIPVAGVLASAPAVAVEPDGEQDVFWKGKDGHLWEAWYANDRWNATSLGDGTLGSQPAAGADKAGEQFVFWRGVHGQLQDAWYTKRRTKRRWYGPVSIPAAGRIGSAPTVAVHADGEQDVFWKGADGHLWEAYFTRGQWAATRVGGGTLGSQPAAGADRPGHQYVFWKGTDGRLWEAWYAGKRWQASQPIPQAGRIQSAPAVAVQGSGEQDVFWQGVDGNLWEAYYLSNRWHAYAP